MSRAVRHQVIFDLKHPNDSAEAAAFIADGRSLLSAIPGVENFSAFRQISPKNDYAWGFSMDFADEDAYARYHSHPAHRSFVRDRWQAEVVRFLEIDFAEA